jgi:hypothetical protein
VSLLLIEGGLKAALYIEPSFVEAGLQTRLFLPKP